MERVDVVVVGGGIAGAAAACELSAHGSVALVEQDMEKLMSTMATIMERVAASLFRELSVLSAMVFSVILSCLTLSNLRRSRGTSENGKGSHENPSCDPIQIARGFRLCCRLLDARRD